jgi:hypothetical protein
MLEQLKETVCKDNKALPKNGLVLWTSGNVSAKDPETEYVVIKPSGILYCWKVCDKFTKKCGYPRRNGSKRLLRQNFKHLTQTIRRFLYCRSI